MISGNILVRVEGAMLSYYAHFEKHVQRLGHSEISVASGDRRIAAISVERSQKPLIRADPRFSPIFSPDSPYIGQPSRTIHPLVPVHCGRPLRASTLNGRVGHETDTLDDHSLPIQPSLLSKGRKFDGSGASDSAAAEEI